MTEPQPLTELEEQWPVVVVGAGPAGTAAGIELARQGVRTLLVDRKTVPRPKVCGGCLNGVARRQLVELGVAARLEEAGSVSLDRLRLFSGGREARLRVPAGTSVTRSTMDTLLVERAVEAGCRYLSAVTAELGEVDDTTRSVTLSRGGQSAVVRAGAVVLAAGLSGQGLGKKALEVRENPSSRIGFGTVADTSPEWVEPGAIHMVVGREGYVGLARAEFGRLSVAAAVDPAAVRGRGAREVCQGVLDENGVPISLDELNGSWAGTTTLTRRAVVPASTRLLCVGDSAGYVEPFTGEGMAWALVSGRLAASLAARGVADWSENLEDEWGRLYRDRVARKQRTCRWIASGLRRPWLVSSVVFAGRHAPWLLSPIARRVGVT